MMLIDKGFYDYDYEPVPPAPVDAAKTALTDTETKALVSRFGFGVETPKTPAEMDISELQEYAMREQSESNN